MQPFKDVLKNILNDRLSAQSESALSFVGKFLISAQVRLATQLKLGFNLNKWKRAIFVTDFRRNLGGNL